MGPRVRPPGAAMPGRFVARRDDGRSTGRPAAPPRPGVMRCARIAAPCWRAAACCPLARAGRRPPGRPARRDDGARRPPRVAGVVVPWGAGCPCPRRPAGTVAAPARGGGAGARVYCTRRRATRVAPAARPPGGAAHQPAGSRLAEPFPGVRHRYPAGGSRPWACTWTGCPGHRITALAKNPSAEGLRLNPVHQRRVSDSFRWTNFHQRRAFY